VCFFFFVVVVVVVFSPLLRASHFADVKIGEYHLDLIPVDNDVLSMELPNSFREFAVDGDRTSLFYVAKALMKLQFLFGIIPNIQGKGEHAQVRHFHALHFARFFYVRKCCCCCCCFCCFCCFIVPFYFVFSDFVVVVFRFSFFFFRAISRAVHC
jgi:hypothetical protein